MFIVGSNNGYVGSAIGVLVYNELLTVSIEPKNMTGAAFKADAQVISASVIIIAIDFFMLFLFGLSCGLNASRLAVNKD